MRAIRSILDADILALKGATDACFTLGGGPTSFAHMTRVGISTLSKYASPSDEWHENVVPIDIAVEADRRAKTPIIVGEAARILGYRLVPDDGAISEARKISDCDVMDLMKEATDVFVTLREARADGRICAGDREAIERQLRELEREIAEIRINMAEG